MRACFIGHRKININTKLVVSLKQTIIALIDKGVKTFLFGSMSEFDDLSWKTVTALKNKYPFIKRVYVRAAYQCIDKSYEDYLLKSYEETYYPPQVRKSRKIFLCWEKLWNDRQFYLLYFLLRRKLYPNIKTTIKLFFFIIH